VKGSFLLPFSYSANEYFNKNDYFTKMAVAIYNNIIVVRVRVRVPYPYPYLTLTLPVIVTCVVRQIPPPSLLDLKELMSYSKNI
jgi:hypothetical protein